MIKWMQFTFSIDTHPRPRRAYGQLIYIDPFGVLPCEPSLKVLAHLDATSLCRAAQVSKRWKALADDSDDLWRRIRE
ncbi:hypothetical protein M405DRAFT_641639 [Rhizopogon salebrosus TDB-379]|nr:hypothetical protein M405DRAFT_641639 [Rhizopogon salebrosus TDB-379]